MSDAEKVLKQQLKQAYPGINSYFIDLVVSYCEDHSLEEVEQMLAEVDNKQQENIVVEPFTIE